MPILPPSPFPDASPTPGLHAIEAVDAFKLAMQSSHLSFREISRLMGWSETFARRVFSAEKFYPSFENLPKFCAVTGNMVIIQWLLAKAAVHGLNPEHPSVDCRALLLRVTDIFADAGDVAAKARAAVKDSLLRPHEIRRLLSALQVVLEDGCALLGDLRAQVQRQGAERG